MAEFIPAILGPVVESLMGPVKKHMGYLFSSTERVRNMTTRMKQLEGKFGDVKNHKDTNERNSLEVPTRVPSWLEEVTKIKSDVETISSNENGCFNIKARYQMGRSAWKTTQKIEGLLQEERDFSWTDALKPLGKVDSRKASTSAPSTGDVFNSRDTTFKDASKLLQQDQKTQLIALCGMGGVGKTTMMEQLKKDMEDKKVFDWIVKVVIGNQPNWHSIQKAVAENLGNPLTEEIETTRADRLQLRFEEILKESGKGILVMLDDVWKKIELGDLGLSPLPNGVKLLLTSRDEHICKQIAVEGNLDFKVLPVNVLEQTEAHKFFCQITKISEESDPELYEIGGDIVKKCSCLPLAIKLIASNLLFEEKSIWKDCLARLRNNDLEPDVQKIIKISYDYIKDQEDKEVFLLCGLFPEDSNIPIEDLTRYAWGLKLLNGVSTVEDGRNRIKKCVRNLRKANLLIDADYRGCVKMHDLVLAFVLDTISEGDYTSIVNHGDMSNWSNDNMREPCKRISLTCWGKYEFPEGFKYQNLLLLKLMYGGGSFKFPQGFYENMEKLKVIAYEYMHYPSLPRSFQCSTNLQTLCLHRCSLMFDCSFIGDLSNLEVLSITQCNMRKLPSTFGNLKKLKVLDLTDFLDLLIIDDGVLNRLVKLEELYMICVNGEAIRFTDANVDELAECSKNLTALAIRFNALPKNISFKKLERFKISLGCSTFQFIYDQSEYAFENTLELVTDKRELLDSRMSQLFDKTELLYLHVNGVNNLEDGLADPLHHRPTFRYLRVLKICECADLRYLFTVCVANNLNKLERLTISSCPVLETVVDGNKSGVGVIKLQALKSLSLDHLPKLTSLCNIVDVIELPQLMDLQLNGLPNFTSIYPLETSSTSITIYERQSFLNKEVVIPKLEKLHISNMENLEEVWPSSVVNLEEANVSLLREIEVRECNNLVNLFPIHPMSLLHHLEELTVEDCGSIEVLFNIDLGCIIEETSCCLRRIEVKGCNNLVNLFPSNPMLLLHHLEELEVSDCSSIEVLFNIDLGCIIEETSCCLRRIQVKGCNNLVNLFPSNPMSLLHHLEELYVENCSSIEVLFNIDLGCIIEETSCCLRRIGVKGCNNLVNLFPSNPMLLLHHLEELEVSDCSSIEVLFNIDLGCIIEETSCCLRRIKVEELGNLRQVWWIKGENDNSLAFSGFQAIEILEIRRCKRFRNVFTPTTTNFDMRALSNLKIDFSGLQEQELCWDMFMQIDEEISEQEINEVISEEVGDDISNVVFSSHLIRTTFHHLRTLAITNDKRAEVVFEVENPCSRELATTPQQPLLLPYLSELRLKDMECMSHVWKCNWNKFLIIPQNQQSFHNLTTISLFACKNIKYLFSPLMAKLLSNLKEIVIRYCDVIEEVVSNQDDEHKELVASTSTNISISLFPHLDILDLVRLPNLKRIGGGSTKISSTTPIHDQSKEVAQVNDVSWSLCQYSRKIHVSDCRALPYVIPSYALEQMQKLQELKVDDCKSLVEVFETQGSGGNDATMVIQIMKKIIVPQLSSLKKLTIVRCRLLEHVLTFSTLESLTQLESLKIRNCEAMKVIVKEDNEEQTTISSKVVVFPHLKSIELKNLPNLTGFFLGKKEFEWPSLNDVEIVGCPQMMVFTSGCSIAQKLNYIRTELGKHILEQYGLNFPATLHEIPSSSLDTTSSSPTTSKGRPWSFHNLIEIDVKGEYDVKMIIPSIEFRQLQKLEKIHVRKCHLVEEVFEALEGTDGSELQYVVVEIPKLREVVLERLDNLKYIWKNNPWMVLKFPNLTKLSIKGCHSLEHVFSSSMVGSLLQLQDLHIEDCEKLEVIVMEENVVVEEGECDDKVNEIIMLPRLMSLTLNYLPSLKGFYLGKEGFSWSSLDTLDIEECPAITVFTMGHLTTPKLKVIDTSFGRCELVTEQDLNSFINTKLKEGLKFGKEYRYGDEDEDEERVDTESEPRKE